MLEPARSILGAKCRVREALKMAGIPYTIISSNWIQGFLLPRAGDPEANAPPETRVTIPGDGTTQESRFPLNFQLAVVHWTLVATKPKVHEEVTGALAGDEVEATELYPELKYITVEEFLGSLP
ncbi:hypothetical protein PR202_gb20378 [Eleusine coracana subsp. coracana]|uniref:NmrA-like domain-containing protein n=1 Tax=Eleusine coracana subsp. coracana TaxID=191504 RepID=A0AAV5FCF1_ELECO|nr:hypothetical protein PR202_gb20378 [Eleusine coracana subsp. coracana]